MIDPKVTLCRGRSFQSASDGRLWAWLFIVALIAKAHGGEPVVLPYGGAGAR
jgi:hypothetical protein